MAASKSQPKHRLATPEKMQQPTIKKSRKSAQCAEDIFLNFPVMLVKGLADVLNHCLLDKNSFSFKTLTALKILNCNAADPRQGNSFSHVFCSVEPYRQLYALGDVFIKGLSMLTDFITTRQAPQNDEDKDVLSKLLIFLMELMTRETEKTPMKNLDGYNETELAMVLANHLFGKLSTTESFVINERSKFKGKLRGNTECPCEIPTCHLDGQFGNTNVGNSTVWHGHLCILLNNAVVLEPVLTGGFGGDSVDTDTDYTDDSDDDSDGDNPGRKSQVKDCLSRNSSSYLQKQLYSHS
ncbi:uncharacterized protein [Argopecten irradians]|uniref:uncharacterized protein n=1 Tax=Argopecten irradians TaxID=31199 RepID=UPI003716F1A3